MYKICNRNLLDYSFMKIRFKNPTFNATCVRIGNRKLSTVPTRPFFSDDEVSLYPTVKPMYPAGKWENINAESAWKIHELSHKVLQISRVKERLEFLAGNDSQILWLVKSLAPRPNNLKFQKIITKSHIMPGYPDQLKSIAVNAMFDASKSLLEELHDLEFAGINHDPKMMYTYANISDQHLHNYFASMIKLLVALLSKKKDHLLSCEIDENVRVESFWRVAGFEKGKSCDGSWDLIKTIHDVDAGILHFQFKNIANLQIRTELPLCQFRTIDDNVCLAQGSFMPMHAPDLVGITSIEEKPTNVSGHWIGSPCEFTACSVHIMPKEFVNKFQGYGDEYLKEAEEIMALTTMFGSCVAQAHNQGFCDLLDLTYPITTQCIIVNKHHVRFACYQLNTLQLWNDANPRQNLMWISEPINILTKLPNSNNVTVDKYFVEYMLKTLLFEPQGDVINLRPFLPDEKSPLITKYSINFKGEKPFEQPVIGRWQYPKYSIYF